MTDLEKEVARFNKLTTELFTQGMRTIEQINKDFKEVSELLK